MSAGLDWDKLKTFHAAAEAGSLTGAAERLALSQSAVSRQISGLEAELDVKLFHRHARGLLLTEPGRLLFDASEDISRRIMRAESQVQDSRNEPSGVLRVTAPASLGAIWIAPRLKRFRQAFPRIQLRLLLADHELDMANLEADIAVRPWPSTQNDLIQRKLMDVDQHLYASPDYFARRGEPKTIEALNEDHDFLAYGPRSLAPLPNMNWALTAGLADGAPKRAPVVEVNTINGLAKAAEAGLGLVGLPDYAAANNEKLMRILPELDGPKLEVFVVYPDELKGSRRVGAFLEFLVEEARRWRE
ncbi:MAG: LysR family transcriptional regulator [Pseudomonadota bacterium]